MQFLAALVLAGMLFQGASSGSSGQAPATQSGSAQTQSPASQNPPAPGTAPLPENTNPATPDKPLTVNAGAPIIKAPTRTIQIPFIARPPKMEEFESMQPARADMVKITGFIQQFPTDGAQANQRTEVYMGYDHQNLYVVWLCFDKEPGKIRAHRSRRENIFDDDYVEITLDTFHDQRRGLVFSTNPLGIQADGLWSENSGNDTSWDTVWNTWGKLTRQGYVVIQAIPFHNMRFPTGQATPSGASRWTAGFLELTKATGGRVYLPKSPDCSIRKRILADLKVYRRERTCSSIPMFFSGPLTPSTRMCRPIRYPRPRLLTAKPGSIPRLFSRTDGSWILLLSRTSARLSPISRRIRSISALECSFRKSGRSFWRTPISLKRRTNRTDWCLRARLVIRNLGPA